MAPLGAGHAGEIDLVVEVEIGTVGVASGVGQEDEVGIIALYAGVGQTRVADGAGHIAGLAGLRYIVIVKTVFAQTAGGGCVQHSLVVCCTVGAMCLSAACTDLAAVVAGEAVLVEGRAVVLEEADAEGTGHVEEVSGCVEQSVPGHIAGQAFGEVSTGITGGFAGFTVLIRPVVPKHRVALA